MSSLTPPDLSAPVEGSSAPASVRRVDRGPLRAAEGPPERSSLGRYAVVIVLLTLVTLLVVPFLVNRRVVALREEIAAAEPARRAVNRLQYNLVRQMGSLSELAITGDEAAPGAFRAARREEEEIYDALAPLVADLGPEVVERFGEVRALAARWHSLSADEEVVEERAEALEPSAVPRQRRIFEELLAATAALDTAILDSTAQTRERITRAERTGLFLTVALALLALGATAVVVALAVSAQRLADESWRRREMAEAALEETARAHQARERLLRGITHDVKNPLGAAKGYADLLEMGVKAPMLPEQAPLVEGLQRSIDGALAIIADLLDVARADSGGLALQPRQLDLMDVLSVAVEDHRAAAEAAGHSLQLQRDDGPLLVRSDRMRVRQIVDNLLSNALKYTPPPGRVRVRAERVDHRGARDGAWVAVHVLDNGPGIPAHMRERIFDEFVRLDDGAEAEGHGLGLAIGRRIARLLGGDLTVGEAEGGGADFVLWLPLGPS